MLGSFLLLFLLRRAQRAVFCRRRCSLAFINSVMSAAGLHYGACSEAAVARLLLACADLFLRSRVEKKLAHLAGHIAGDGSLARPRECLVHIGGFQYPKTAHVLLGLSVWPIGDEHCAIRLLPHRLCVDGPRNSASELPHACSNQFAVECVDLLDHRFGYGGRVEVVGQVVSNEILWHDFFSLFSVVCSR